MRIPVAVLVACALSTASGRSNASEKIYLVGGEVAAPVKIKDCRLLLPPDLRARRIVQPFFFYEAVISKRGHVESLRLIKGPHGDPYDRIENLFRKQILCSQFRAATLRGHPVAVRFNISATAEVR